jgi:Ca2+-binding RTX toxin-like protein
MALAAGASLLLNLAMLMPSLYTLQVFDRVCANIGEKIDIAANDDLDLAAMPGSGDGANDIVTVEGTAGDDVIQAGFVQATGPQLTLDGGEGNDLLTGGLGDDVLIGGLGQDALDGGPGENTLLQ